MEKKESRTKGISIKLTERQKKIGLTALLCVGIIAIGCVNYFVNNGASLPEDETVSYEEDSFAVFRQEKSDSRAEQISYIDSVSLSESATEETKQQAQQQKLELAANMEAETAVEGMIRTTMDADCVVTVSSSAVSVVIDRAQLTDAEAAQIAEIVIAQTGQSANNIKIMPQEKDNHIEN